MWPKQSKNTNCQFEGAYQLRNCKNIYLAVLSASELTGGGGIYSYNFSTGIGKAHGGSLGYKYLGNNVRGVVSEDGNADGKVTFWIKLLSGKIRLAKQIITSTIIIWMGKWITKTRMTLYS